MITVRKADKRGVTNLDWLKSYHTFSFSSYHDPKNVHFRHLRVINDDYIAPGGGFGMHPHNDMEIITFIHNGSLKHKDSLGNGSIIQSGEIQRMTAGSGIMHSEFNPSATEDVHLYQIWIFPDKKNLEPSYEQVSFDKSKAESDFLLLASNAERADAIRINQDLSLFLSSLQKQNEIEYSIKEGRNIWIQVISGEFEVNGTFVKTGDGLAITDESFLKFKALDDSEFLLFDMN